jgi:hypothetical protein
MPVFLLPRPGKIVGAHHARGTASHDGDIDVEVGDQLVPVRIDYQP